MRRIIVCLVITLAALVTAGDAQQPAGSISGCLTGDPGSFTLGAVPSGNSYRLQGNTNALAGHLNQLVRLTGNQTTAAANDKAGEFNVRSVEVLASTCTAPLPQQNPSAVRSAVGKAGADQTSVPTTDTRSAGEVTPGAQTEAGAAQQPGKHTDIPAGEKNQPPARGPLAPPQWGQVGQNQQSGDRGAAAAERAEEESSHTLGVNAVPTYEKNGKPQGSPASQAIGSNTSTTGGSGGMATETPAQATNPPSGETNASTQTTANNATGKSAGAASGTLKGQRAHRRKHHKKSTTQQGSEQQDSSTPPQ